MASDLYQRIAQPESLAAGWARVRQGGRSPGLDGVTLEGFERRAPEELARLRRELRQGEYRPWPARRVGLAKRDGGTRWIGIQSVRDRVAQRAVLHELQPRVEPRLENASHAYRPGRSVETALAHLEGYRAGGFDWAVRADVSLCFDSLDRQVLEASLHGVLPEPDVQSLLRAWLTAGTVDDHGWRDAGVGVLQGDVLSPLLCNLYLDAFDEAVTAAGFGLVRYADDFVLVARGEAAAWEGARHAAEALARLRLRLNREKSRVGTFLQGFEFLGAAVVGSLRLPLHRVERPGLPPAYGYGYAPPPARRRLPEPVAPVTKERELRDRFVALLRAERAGRPLSAMEAALLRAWQAAEPLPAPRRTEPAGWQSAYLI